MHQELPRTHAKPSPSEEVAHAVIRPNPGPATTNPAKSENVNLWDDLLQESEDFERWDGMA